MTVYVIHFKERYKHAQHYIGWTSDPDASRRFEEHVTGRGSPLVAAAVAAGIMVGLVDQWPDAGRDFERWLKSRGSGARSCPCCSGSSVRPTPDRITPAFRESKVW